jgi:hypothetical protein
MNMNDKGITSVVTPKKLDQVGVNSSAPEWMLNETIRISCDDDLHQL